MKDIKLCHPQLQIKAARLLEECEKQGLKIKIGETLRTREEQDALYAQGRTKPGNIVTNAPGSSYSSYHQWGTAFDIYRNDGKGAYNESGDFFTRVGKIGKSVGLEWGGDWKNIVDKPHFQLPDWGSSTAGIKKKYGTPDVFMKTWIPVTPGAAGAGWEHDGQGRYKYRNENGSYAAGEWQQINCHWYLFGTDGYMLTGWQKWNGRVVEKDEQGDWYYFDETHGGPLEGACWHERPGNKGALEIWQTQ